MKVTVKNPNTKPVNISKLAPLMPVQTLGVNQEVTVSVRDIEGVMQRATKIGVTVTPVEAFEITNVVEPEHIVETLNSVDVEPETDKKETEVTDTIETPTETHEVTPEKVEPSVDNTVVDEKKSKPETKKKETKAKTTKKTPAKKSTAKAKKTTTKKKLFG